MYKGIFWYIPSGNKLITTKVRCNNAGTTLKYVEFSSKSNENFNHKAEWAKLPLKISKQYPYNYFPRGRVEIKKGKATIFFNPDLNTETVRNLILDEFGLNPNDIPLRFVSDGSSHYEYLTDM